jgi:hypothetical protein
MTTRQEKEKQRLRQYLNPAIRGKNTEAVLEALSMGQTRLIENVEAVNDSIYIVKAKGRYLDSRLADRELTRPENVGLSDDVFRQIGIEVSNRKQIRDLILSLLEIIYGEEFTRATAFSSEFETYALEDGDTLKIQFDDEAEPVEVTFQTSQFANIAAATAQEVADAITKQLRNLGRRGAAFAKDDGIGGYVVLISQTIGPASAIRVVGGKAQNKLKFDKIRPTSGDSSTQWTLTQQSGGVIRATWTGGANPSVGKVRKGDYTTVYGTAFNIANRGTFTITAVQGGLIGDAYVEFSNPNGIAEIVVQGNSEAILFYNPYRTTLSSKATYAAAYQTEARLLEVFIPATTKVVRRDRIGAAHIHDTGPSGDDQQGPYIFEDSKPYTIGKEECNTTQTVDSNTGIVIEVDNSADIPDNSGFVVFGFGTSKEEGPVPYIARPSSNTLMVNPSYRFKNVHAPGTNISLIAQNFVYDVKTDGTDYAFYLTDVVSGRIYAEELIKLVAATGIRLVITILYPGDEGMGKWGTDNSEKYYVFGPDPE